MGVPMRLVMILIHGRKIGHQITQH
jgi:hypothetical protein